MPNTEYKYEVGQEVWDAEGVWRDGKWEPRKEIIEEIRINKDGVSYWNGSYSTDKLDENDIFPTEETAQIECDVRNSRSEKG